MYSICEFLPSPVESRSVDHRRPQPLSAGHEARSPRLADGVATCQPLSRYGRATGTTASNRIIAERAVHQSAATRGRRSTRFAQRFATATGYPLRIWSFAGRRHSNAPPAGLLASLPRPTPQYAWACISHDLPAAHENEPRLAYPASLFSLSLLSPLFSSSSL